MKRLVKHIEQLLYHEECVVVPGLGAFLRHDRPAEIDERKGFIQPGHSELTFNGQLSHNDGLLIQAYCKAYSFGYKKAVALVEKDVEQLLSSLRNFGVVQLGSVGKLMLEQSEGRIVFHPNPQHPFSIEYYGLMPTSILPELQVRDSSDLRRSKRKGEVVYLPINLRYVKYTTAAAIIAIAIFLFPQDALKLNTHSTEGQTTQHQAGFSIGVPASFLPIVVEPTIEQALKENILEAKEESVTEQSTLGKVPLLQAPLSSPRYLVVISSLRNLEEAERLLEQNPDFVNFSNAGIYVAKNGRVRIFSHSFETMDEAQKELNQIVRQPGYETAWIYQAK